VQRALAFARCLQEEVAYFCVKQVTSGIHVAYGDRKEFASFSAVLRYVYIRVTIARDGENEDGQGRRRVYGGGVRSGDDRVHHTQLVGD